MVKDLVLVKQQRRIEVHLTRCPEALATKSSRVIWIVVSEEMMLSKEVISFELLLLGVRILWLGLKICS